MAMYKNKKHENDVEKFGILMYSFNLFMASLKGNITCRDNILMTVLRFKFN